MAFNEANNTSLLGRWESDFKLTILTFWTKFTPKRIFPVKNKKSEHHYWILHIRISLGTKFQFKLIILTFWTNCAQKGYFQSKTKKVNSITEFCIFELFYVSSVTLNWQFWHFGPNLPKKDISNCKRKKWKPPLNSGYSNWSRYQVSP